MDITQFNGFCPKCGKEINFVTEFTDNLSVKEYFISGLCQSCQDNVFGIDIDKSYKRTENYINRFHASTRTLEENIKIVQDALYNIIEDVKIKLPNDIFCFDDFYIAGGCIYSIWNDKNPKDYDIFCKNKKALTKLKKYFKNNRCNFISENAITYGKYQFVTKWYGDPHEVVGKFDFKHNMFYYDSNGLHNIVDWDFLNTNQLHFNNLRARDVASILIRIPKFIDRGMEIESTETAEIIDVLTRPKKYIKEKLYIKKAKKTYRSGY